MLLIKNIVKPYGTHADLRRVSSLDFVKRENFVTTKEFVEVFLLQYGNLRHAGGNLPPYDALLMLFGRLEACGKAHILQKIMRHMNFSNTRAESEDLWVTFAGAEFQRLGERIHLI